MWVIKLLNKIPLSVRSGEFVAKHIEPVENCQVQPNGVDLTVDKISKFIDAGSIETGEAGVKLPNKQDVTRGFYGNYKLNRGVYELRYEEEIHIPPATVGLVLPRSSLMRCGAMINTALWDQGYRGVGMGLLRVGNGLEIEHGARVVQMIFIAADDSTDYEGQYQGENLED